MKIRNILALSVACICLTITFLSCSGSRDHSGGGASVNTKAIQSVVLPTDQLVTHETGDISLSLPNDQKQPAVAYDTIDSSGSGTTGTGKYLVVWTDKRNELVNCGGSACGTDIYGAICTGSGTGTSTGMACGDSFVIAGAAGSQTQPKVAFYPDTVTPANSKYLVVWTDPRSGVYSQIYGQFVNTSGSLKTRAGAPGSDNFTISTYTAGVDINQYDADLLYDPVISQFVVAWTDVSTFDTNQNTASDTLACGAGGIICTGGAGTLFAATDSFSVSSPEIAYITLVDGVTSVTNYSTSRETGSSSTTVTINGGSNAIGESSLIVTYYIIRT